MMDDYANYKEEDLAVCDTLCDACVLRMADDLSRCRKFPEGKPDEVLDPDYFCPEFAMTELDLK